MKKVLVLGATGMLGHVVYDVLSKMTYNCVLPDTFRTTMAMPKYLVTGTVRQGVQGRPDQRNVIRFDCAQLFANYVAKTDWYFKQFVEQADQFDWLINCIGVTIPYANTDSAMTMFVNGTLPHLLSQRYGPRLIHITTDCIYDGKNGGYTENDTFSPVDLYGVSKMVGEPRTSITLRTSIIGRELHGMTGLVEWFRRQSGQTISGYENHFWNGITTRQFGLVCDEIMNSPFRDWMGVHHIYSTTQTKYEMLLAFREKYNIDCEIIPTQTGPKVDRTLGTLYTLNAALNIPSFHQMLKDSD